MDCDYITIGSCVIKMDTEGRFCVNDLHKAAGGEDRHKPIEWIRLVQTADLVKELEKVGVPTIKTVRGRNGGTYVCREMVVSYASWISPAFNVTVLRTFSDLTMQPTLPMPMAPPSPPAPALSHLDTLRAILGSIEEATTIAVESKSLATETHARVVLLETNLHLEYGHQKDLSDAVHDKVAELMGKHKELNKNRLYPAVWRLLKDTFRVPRYMEIPELKFGDALKFVQGITLTQLAGFSLGLRTIQGGKS